MQDLPVRRAKPFALAVGVLAFASVVVFRVPDILLDQLHRARPLTDAQAGWAYRLLAVAAVAQALYGGFVVLRVEKVESARRKDAKVARMERASLVASIARNAAGMIVLTLVYGLAAIGLTAERAGFWLFAAVAVAQAAWYYREVGAIARWVSFQPEPVAEDPRRHPWKPAPPDYCPPLARGMRRVPFDARDPAPRSR